MFKTCQKTLTHDKNPKISTYCQRPEGHEKYDPKGKCAEEATAEDLKKDASDAQALKEYRESQGYVR